MVDIQDFIVRNKRRLLAFLFLAILIVAVRAYFYSGPIFANTQDEGIYLTTFSGHIKFGNPIGFSEYKNANFSNQTSYLFNPANSFQFYVGLEYPIIFIESMVGYSASMAIIYVILTSLIEGLLIFLIVEKIAGTRAGVMGGIIFAFMPLDVLFGTHIQPLVPMVMMVTAAVYVFLVVEDARKTARMYRYTLLALVGIFAGLAYITNPLALLLPIFLFLYLLYGAFTDLKTAKKKAIDFLFIAGGFLLAYSLIGALYLVQAGNFFLYPMMTHAEFTYIMLTQPLSLYCTPLLLSHQVCAQYAVGMPTTYLKLLFNQTIPSNQYLTYFGYSFLAFIAMALLYVFYLPKGKKSRRIWFFLAMFLFYLIVMSFLPMNLKSEGAKTVIFMADQQPYYSVLFVLPMVAIMGIVMDQLMAMGGRRSYRYAVLAGCALLIFIVAMNVAVLNKDVALYRGSMYTEHQFLSFVKAHPNSTFYAEWEFSNNVNLLSGFDYKINRISCSASEIANRSGPVYIAIGGSISMDMDPSILENFYSCIAENITNGTVVYTVPNPSLNSSPLKIIKIG